MRWNKIIVTHLVAIALAAMVAAAAEDVEVIRSQGSTLSIYSYGGLVPSRVIPELPDREPNRGPDTGALTDVVSTPPLAVSVPLAAAPASSFPTAKAMAVPMMSSASSATPATNGTSTPNDVVVPDKLSPIGRTVMVGWNQSPDESVVGYEVYAGDSSHQYTSRTVIGNQTFAQVAVDQSAVYVAVSAYTLDGLESSLSEELVVGDNAHDDSGSSGGTQANNSAYQ